MVQTDYAGNPDALVAAAQWIQGTLLGSVATAIAVIAVAGVGLMMLGGRIDLRRGGTVIIGCFLLFGAPYISAGLMNLGEERGPVEVTPEAQTQDIIGAPAPPRRQPAPSTYDPYAGAAVPS